MQTIIILDFGSQYTQLIARKIRELNVYCEIHAYNKIPTLTPDVKGVVLSGSPYSCNDAQAPIPDLSQIKGRLPLLAVCYGAQYLAKTGGGKVLPSTIREYGRANLQYIDNSNPLLYNVPGVVGGNWGWRMEPDALTPELAEEVRDMTETYNRCDMRPKVKDEDEKKDEEAKKDEKPKL